MGSFNLSTVCQSVEKITNNNTKKVNKEMKADTKKFTPIIEVEPVCKSLTNKTEKAIKTETAPT